MNFTKSYISILTSLGMESYATTELAEKFELLYRRLVEFNSHTNLTAITDESAVILRHFADSLTAAPLIGSESGSAVIDVGCGGGFPVLPLAIVRPDLHFTALDSTAKKLAFVAEMADELHLPVKILSARAEEVAKAPVSDQNARGKGARTALSEPIPTLRESFDLALSRAVARMPVLAELTLPFVKVGGRLIALKGAEGDLEAAEAATAIPKLGGKLKHTHRLTLADAGERVLLEIEKCAPTPIAYPRAYGQIKKRPL